MPQHSCNAHARGTSVPGPRRRRGGEEGYGRGIDIGSLQERGRRGSYGSLGGFIVGVRRPDNKVRIGNCSASVAHLSALGMTILVPWQASAGGVDAVQCHAGTSAWSYGRRCEEVQQQHPRRRFLLLGSSLGAAAAQAPPSSSPTPFLLSLFLLASLLLLPLLIQALLSFLIAAAAASIGVKGEMARVCSGCGGFYRWPG